MGKIEFLIDYFKYLKNPIEALKLKFGVIDSCDVKIKNKSDVLTINNVKILNKLIHNLPLISEAKYPEFISHMTDLINDKKYVEIDGISYVNTLNTTFLQKSPYEYNVDNGEYFTDDGWDMINVNGRSIIDIGGNVADTALEFAKNGAEVIAFEPVKHLYEVGLENISLNPHLKDKITFINKAVGAKRGTLDITANSLKDYINPDDDYQIEVTTIHDIINDYNIEPDILKMDCEGCEFEIIPNENLTMFNDIMFEHHSEMTGKDYKELIEILKENGFEINTYECNASRKKFEKIGIIHAFK